MVRRMLSLSPELSTYHGGDVTWSQVSAVTYLALNAVNIVIHAVERTKLPTLDKSLILGSVVLGLDGLVSPFLNNGEPLHKKLIIDDPKNLILTAEYILAFGGQGFYLFKNAIK
jgi:hypothetical protein